MRYFIKVSSIIERSLPRHALLSQGSQDDNNKEFSPMESGNKALPPSALKLNLPQSRNEPENNTCPSNASSSPASPSSEDSPTASIIVDTKAHTEDLLSDHSSAYSAATGSKSGSTATDLPQARPHSTDSVASNNGDISDPSSDRAMAAIHRFAQRVSEAQSNKQLRSSSQSSLSSVPLNARLSPALSTGTSQSQKEPLLFGSSASQSKSCCFRWFCCCFSSTIDAESQLSSARSEERLTTSISKPNQ